MIDVNEIKAKSIIVKTSLPNCDYVINPYTGCMHACIYCYASFMNRFTNHNKKWGKYVDVKINAKDLIPKYPNKFKNKSITISSVCDPYQPIEAKYKITRSILEKLQNFDSEIFILTKSKLILRDIDLIKSLKHSKVCISLSLLDDKVREEVEPLASTVNQRLFTLKKLKEEGVYTILFVSPIFPKITDYKQIITKTKKYVNEYWFENLNLKSNNWSIIRSFLKKYNSNLIPFYKDLYFTNKYKNPFYNTLKKEIINFCKKQNCKYKMYFHHNKKVGALNYSKKNK